jgi:hypothetical protein
VLLCFSFVRRFRSLQRTRRVSDTFGPEHVTILMFEEFIKDTQATVNDVLDFLGLKPYVPSNMGSVYDPCVMMCPKF